MNHSPAIFTDKHIKKNRFRIQEEEKLKEFSNIEHFKGNSSNTKKKTFVAKKKATEVIKKKTEPVKEKTVEEETVEEEESVEDSGGGCYIL